MYGGHCPCSEAMIVNNSVGFSALLVCEEVTRNNSIRLALSLSREITRNKIKCPVTER